MSEKIYTMQKQLDVGKIGENEILRFLGEQKQVEFVEDLRDDPVARDYDVDFAVHVLNGKHLFVEVKTDTYSKSGNIFYEEISSTNTNTLGCFEKTAATYILYVFPDDRLFYVLKMRPFREWYHKEKQRFAEKLVQNPTYKAKGRLISRKVLESIECQAFVSLRKLSKSA
ncbi:MAG: hypothetical protein RR415_11665 [Ruthenibacterium sp.]